MSSTIRLISAMAENARFNNVQGHNAKNGDWIIDGYDFWCNGKMYTVKMNKGVADTDDLQKLVAASAAAEPTLAPKLRTSPGERGNGLN